MNIMDIVLSGLVVLWLLGAIIYMTKKKKTGRCTGCDGANCSSCQNKKNGI